MKDRKLASRYARALLAAIPDPTTAERIASFLGAVGETLETSRPVREALEDPATPRSARLKALQEIARGQNMPRELEAFLSTVVDHGRIDVLPAIAEVYRELREESEGVVAATITTAQPMTPELEDRARAALETMTGKKIRLTTQVDATLIGGAVTQVGSMVYDGSLRTQLANLRRRMAQE
jgi:F-type H+-transporting ATPase subunit delta